MGNHTIGENRNDVNRAVVADDLRWTLPPLPRLEETPRDDRDLLDVPPDVLLEYACDLRAEVKALRLVLRESLTTVAQLTAQLNRSKYTVITLHTTVRELRRAA